MFYGEDVAHTHDTGHSEFAQGAGEWLAGELSPPGLVVELGCGGGVSSRILADAGFEVIGVDLSEPLLARARRRVPEGRFVRASFLDFELPPDCLAVTAFSEVLNYLADERVARESLAALFARVHAALRPGGLFAFDVLEAGEPYRSWSEGAGWLICVEVTVSGRSLLRRIVSLRAASEGDAWRRCDEDHHVLLADRDEVRTDLTAAGFDVEVLDAYGPMAFRPGLVGFAARRR